MAPTPSEWWGHRWVLVTLLLLSTVPLLGPAVPPLLDLPAHMGRYRVMLGTDAPLLDQWYRFGWKPIGYLGVDLMIAAIGPVLGLEPAVKLVAIAIPALTVAGTMWVQREAQGRVQPTILFALPLAYNLPFQFGFLNFTLAMALALNAFAWWLRLSRQRRVRLRAVLFLGVGALVWTAHLFGWLLLGAMVFAAQLAQRRSEGNRWLAAGWRAAFLDCLPLAPPALILLHWTPGDGTAGSDLLESLLLKPGWMGSVFRDRWQLFDILCAAAIATLLYRAARANGLGWSPPLGFAALALFATFLIMPFGSAYADARILPYAVVLALLAIRPRDNVPRRELHLLALAGLAFFLARTAATTASFAIESRDWNRRLVAVDQLPRGARVASFASVGCEPAWRLPRLGHLPSMAIVRRAAFANDQFDLGITALLRVVAPGLDGFALDPSQVVTSAPCPSGEFRTLAGALATFPRAQFDHLWLLDKPAGMVPTGTTVVWSDGRDWLYRIDKPRLMIPRPSR